MGALRRDILVGRHGSPGPPRRPAGRANRALAPWSGGGGAWLPRARAGG